MKRLLLLRHADAEQVNKDTPADSERRLTGKGRDEAAHIGRAMREKGYAPDLILCSPARRARQTLEFANAELHSAARVEFVDAIYAAGAQRLLKLFQNVSDASASLLAVGHNPGFEECAALLLGPGQTLNGPVRSRGEKFPTAALAVLDFEIAGWPALSPSSGALAAFLRPGEQPLQ